MQYFSKNVWIFFPRPVIIEVPHFASLRGREREITILRSDNGESWREHTLEASDDAVHDVFNESFEGEGKITYIQVLSDLFYDKCFLNMLFLNCDFFIIYINKFSFLNRLNFTFFFHYNVTQHKCCIFQLIIYFILNKINKSSFLYCILLCIF